MLLGEYSASLGEKNRIAIPKKLRDDLSGKVFITRGYENCLLIFDNVRWNSFIKIINEKPLLKLEVRDTKRFLIGGAQEIDYDIQGRFVLPEYLKNFAKIDQLVTFLGVNEWVEIWSTEIWQSKLDSLNENATEIAERLTEL